MSFHIITVLKQGARLSTDRGFLVCQYPDDTENRIVLADVRAIIIGVPSVAFTNTCLARLLEQDSMVLHCNEHYKPIGWTIPLDRVIRKEVFANQLQQDQAFEKALWERVVKQKMNNQAAVLDVLAVEHDLYRLINKPLANEANISRQYWGRYFQAIGPKQKRERQGAESFENKALNYGYAVVSTLVHRAILIHGLLPSLGIHHEARYRSYPLVYDLVEPFRAFVDLFLAKWVHDRELERSYTDQDFSDWIRYLMSALRHCRIKIPEDKHSYKLMDAVDRHVRSVAACFENAHFLKPNFTFLWLPKLAHHYWHNPLLGEPEDGGEDEEMSVSL
jgi:CRISPR-associated protein Cas1